MDIYDDIDKGLLERVEDCMLNRGVPAHGDAMRGRKGAHGGVC